MGERGKINRPEHTAGGLQNKGTEKLQRRARPSPLEVGGRGKGKGANSAPEKPPPPTRKTGPGPAARAGAAEGKGAARPWRGCQTSGCPGRSPPREKVHHTRESALKPLAARATEGKGTPYPGRVCPSLWLPEPRREKARHTRGEGAQASGCPSHLPQREKVRCTWGEGAQASGCLGCSPQREKARRTRGEGAQASGCQSLSGLGRHNTQVQSNPRFCGGLENWNRTQRRARSI